MTLTSRYGRLEDATIEMIDEAERALAKHGPENTMDAPGKTDGYRLAILMEEVGEVARELTYDNQGATIKPIPNFPTPCEIKMDERGVWFLPRGSSYQVHADTLDDDQLGRYGYYRQSQKDRLRKELVQVGAMAATWIAYLDEEPDA